MDTEDLKWEQCGVMEDVAEVDCELLVRKVGGKTALETGTEGLLNWIVGRGG